MRLGFVDHLARAATAAIVAAITLLPGTAGAVPALQLYIEGSTYNSTNESWVFTGDTFKLWVLGNVGQFGTIVDVRLTVAVELATTLDPDNISIVPSTATEGLLPSPGDNSTPAVPTPVEQWPPRAKYRDREKLEELVRTLTETLPNVTNLLASATQHARACQKGDLLMQALRARAVFGTLGEAVRDGETHVKNTQSRRA